MLIPKSDESFPLCPPFFSGGRNEQGFTLEFSFEKAERDGQRETEGGWGGDTEILRNSDEKYGRERERNKTQAKMKEDSAEKCSLCIAAGTEEMVEWTLKESVWPYNTEPASVCPDNKKIKISLAVLCPLCVKKKRWCHTRKPTFLYTSLDCPRRAHILLACCCVC